MGKSTISMAIFNSYVKLPEGKFGIDQTCFFQGFSQSLAEFTSDYKRKSGFQQQISNSESVGFQSLGPGTGDMKMHTLKNRSSLETLLEPFAVGLQRWAILWGCNLQGFHTGYEQFWEKENQVWPRSSVNKYGNGASYFFFSVRMPYQTLGHWVAGFCHVLAVEWVAGWCFHLLVNKWHLKVPIHFCSWGGLKPATLRIAGSIPESYRMLSTFIWAVWVKMVYSQADKIISTASTPDQPGL